MEYISEWKLQEFSYGDALICYCCDGENNSSCVCCASLVAIQKPLARILLINKITEVLQIHLICLSCALRIFKVPNQELQISRSVYRSHLILQNSTLSNAALDLLFTISEIGSEYPVAVQNFLQSMSEGGEVSQNVIDEAFLCISNISTCPCI